MAGGLRAALEAGPKSVAELGEMASGFVGNVGLWVDLIRVPPGGTWVRRRADVLALADQWVGPERSTEEEGLRSLLGSPICGGSGRRRSRTRRAGRGCRWPGCGRPPRRWSCVASMTRPGKELLDLPDAPLPDEDTPAPVRLLPHWDANLLVHARRTGLLPETYRADLFTRSAPSQRA